jgi:hypothetical protein
MGRSRVDLGGAGDIKLQEANISGETQFVGGGSTTSLVACAEINDEVFRSQPPCDLPPKALVSAGNQGNLTVMIRTAIATRRSGHEPMLPPLGRSRYRDGEMDPLSSWLRSLPGHPAVARATETDTEQATPNRFLTAVGRQRPPPNREIIEAARREDGL